MGYREPYIMKPPNFSTIPTDPGIYFFRSEKGRHGRILYIGKAANLRSRLRSYFRASAALEPAKRRMLAEARAITWEITDSPIAALIFEAKIIKEKQPPYNVHLRDDKRYFYVGITREDCARVLVTHQPSTPGEATDFIGPFTEGVALKRTLKLLRRVFPYRTHKGYPRKCLQFDMGICPVPPGIDPPSRQTVRTAAQNIRAIRQVLNGDAEKLIRRLEREMRREAKEEDFEAAATLRDQVRGLLRVLDHRNVLEDERRHDITEEDVPATIRRLLPEGSRADAMRIEGYDIANLQDGKAATGSMVVFEQGVPVSDQYKKFKIKTVKGSNDVAMLREVLGRRSKHDWPLPDIMLIDGGLPQVNAVTAELTDWLARMGTSAPLILGLAKREEEIIIHGRAKPLKLRRAHPFLLLLMHVRDEAHRFARRYHHHLRDYR